MFDLPPPRHISTLRYPAVGSSDLMGRNPTQFGLHRAVSPLLLAAAHSLQRRQWLVDRRWRDLVEDALQGTDPGR